MVIQKLFKWSKSGGVSLDLSRSLIKSGSHPSKSFADSKILRRELMVHVALLLDPHASMIPQAAGIFAQTKQCHAGRSSLTCAKPAKDSATEIKRCTERRQEHTKSEEGGGSKIKMCTERRSEQSYKSILLCGLPKTHHEQAGAIRHVQSLQKG